MDAAEDAVLWLKLEGDLDCLPSQRQFDVSWNVQILNFMGRRLGRYQDIGIVKCISYHLLHSNGYGSKLACKLEVQVIPVVFVQILCQSFVFANKCRIGVSDSQYFNLLI